MIIEEIKKEMSVKWDNLHLKKRFRPKYPSELVVQYIFKNFDLEKRVKILDLGCGAGRHSLFMAQEGIEVCGIDFSKNGIEYVKNLFDDNKLNGNFKVATVDSIPYDDYYFDGLICIGVLCYSSVDVIIKACSEIHRVLKCGGKALIRVRSKIDYRFKTGKEIENNTIIVNENDKTKCASNESGMLMHFFEEKELKVLFGKFSTISIDKYTQTCENQAYKDDEFIIRLIK